MSHLQYQSPKAHRPPWYLGREGRVAGAVLCGLLAPLVVSLYETFVVHDTEGLRYWPFPLVAGLVLGWLLGAVPDGIREHAARAAYAFQAALPHLSWRQRLNARGGQVVGWIVVVGFALFVEHRSYTYMIFGDGVTDRAVIERNGGFQLTPGLRKIDASIEGMLDPTFRARIVVSPADLPAFLKSAAVKQPSISAPIPDRLSWPAIDHYTKRWWAPPLPPAQYAAGEGKWIYRDDEGESWNRHQFMLIDESDPSEYVIWIVADSADE